MSNSIDDGGPAFPHVRVPTEYPGIARQITDGGMSLRDWFAGQALAGLLADNRNAPVADWAAAAYQLADAMLAERKRGGGA